MTIDDVVARAEKANIPVEHIQRIRERMTGLDMLSIYEGPGRGCISGRHYSKCFDVGGVEPDTRKTVWCVWQE